MADLKDRVAVYPRRIKITPEGGGTPYYAQWDYADYPTETGTLLNKDTLLSDAAATAVGLSAGATLPSDAFTKLAGDIAGITPANIGAQPAMTAGVDYADPTLISMMNGGCIFTGGRRNCARNAESDCCNICWVWNFTNGEKIHYKCECGIGCECG